MSDKTRSEKSLKSNILNSSSALGFEPISNKEKLGLISLEPRILLDAAGFVTGAEVAMDAMVFEDAQIGAEAIFDPKPKAMSDDNAELLLSLSDSNNLVSEGGVTMDGFVVSDPLEPVTDPEPNPIDIDFELIRALAS